MENKHTFVPGRRLEDRHGEQAVTLVSLHIGAQGGCAYQCVFQKVEEVHHDHCAMASYSTASIASSKVVNSHKIYATYRLDIRHTHLEAEKLCVPSINIWKGIPGFCLQARNPFHVAYVFLMTDTTTSSSPSMAIIREAKETKACGESSCSSGTQSTYSCEGK